MSTPKTHGIHVCVLLHLKADQWRTIVITQVIYLNRYDLFLVILISHTSQNIAKANFNLVAQDILQRTQLKTLMVSPKPWVNNSMEFSRFFSLLHQFIKSIKKNLDFKDNSQGKNHKIHHIEKLTKFRTEQCVPGLRVKGCVHYIEHL